LRQSNFIIYKGRIVFEETKRLFTEEFFFSLIKKEFLFESFEIFLRDYSSHVLYSHTFNAIFMYKSVAQITIIQFFDITFEKIVYSMSLH